MTTAKQSSAERQPKAKETASSFKIIWGQDVASHGFAAVPSILIRAQKRLELTPTQMNIVVQLLDYWVDPNRRPYPSKRDISKRMGVTEKTVQTNVRNLELRGLIRREYRKTAVGDFNSNVYHLDGLVSAIQALEPEFEEKRAERQARAKSRKEAETPPHLRSAEAAP